MDMDFYSNLGSYDSAFNDNLVTSFGGNPANFSINPNNSGSTTSCGLLALNHLARYHSAPTSVLQGLLLDDDDDDDDDDGGGGGDGDLLDISQNSELSRLLNDGIGSFASLIDPPPKPVTLIHGNNTDNNSGTLMNPSTTTTTTITTATNPSANHNLKLNPPLNHNLKLNPHHHANYVNPPDDHHYNMLSNPANMGAPSLNQDVTNLTNLTNQTLISLNAQMNQSLLNQDRLILNPQISLFNHANNNNLMIPNNSSSSNCSSTNHSPTLSSISEQDPITLNNEESHVISLIPNNITIDQGKQSTQYQNHNPNLHSNPNPNLHSNPNPNLNTTNLNLHSNPNPNLNTNNLNLHSNPNPNLNTTNLNGNLNPNPNPSVDCLSNLYKTRPPQGPMMMLPNIGNSVKPSGGLIRHSSSPAHFLSKMAMEEMASNGDHELNGIASSGAYNPHGQRKRGRGGAHELPDKNNMQQHLGQQQMSMSPPLLTSEGLSPPNHVSCFDDIDGSIVDSVLCKARAKRGHATHPRSIAERVRRTKISDRIKKLQDLVPNLDKQANTADMLDEIVEYVKVLQQKIKDLSMDPPMCNCVRQQEQAI